MADMRRSHARRWVAGSVLLVVLALGGAAHAKGEDPCDPETTPQDAQRLAEAGLRLYKEAAAERDEAQRVKTYERALRCFRGAQTASKGAAAKLYHPMGLVYEKLERTVEAVTAYKTFLANVPEARRNPGVTKQITDKLKQLRPLVAELSIDTVAGLEVRVDERAIGRAPLGSLVVVAPGPHVVTVGDPGVGTLGAEVKALAGQVHRVDLSGWRPREAQVAQGEEPTPGQGAVPVPPRPAVPMGQLLVRSNRTGAKVLVDGKSVGETPLPQLALGLGEHRVEGRDGGQRASAVVRLGRDERREVDLRFPIKPWVWAVTGVALAAVAGTAVGLGVYYGTSVNRPDGVIEFR